MLDAATHRVLDAIPTLLFVADAGGHATYCNARLGEFAGRSRAELLGSAWLDLLHPDDRERIGESWRHAVQNGTTWEAECRLRRHDGHYRWHLCRAESTRDAAAGESEWFGSCMDVEARRQAEESRGWLAAIVAASDDAIVSKTLDGTIRSWNAAAERIFGYSAGEVIGQPITLIVPRERLDEEMQILGRLRQGERIDHFETVRVAKDGRRIDVQVTISPVLNGQGQIIGASKVGRDITAQKRAEEALAASRAELRLVTDHAAVMLAHCDADSRYLFVNRAYAGRFGLEAHEVIGRRIPDVIGASAYAVIEPHVKRVLAGERVEFEVSLAYEPFGRRFMHCIYVPENDETGTRVRGFVAAISDVSDRRLLEDRLRETDRRKDEFLAILGHELRNPLAPLSTGLEVLEQVNGDPALTGEVHRVMRRQLTHLVRLVDDLVDVSRISRGLLELRRAPLLLRGVVGAAVELAKPLIEERRHALSVEQAAEPLYVDGDHERLIQVLANLLTNAAKYTHPGGRIRLQSALEGDRVVLRVSDSGLGIPREHLVTIFDMFSQLPEHREHASGSGLGVGLALSRQLVHLHGGSIEATSEGRGRGSEFVIRLPAAVPPAESAQPPSPARDAGRRSVLVVDDNVDAADGLGMVLQLRGHDVRIAYDGQTALREVESRRPDVMLLDIGLPGMSGYEIARRVRATPGGDGILLVAVTGWGQAEARAQTRDAGFDDHLTKPVDTTQIMRLIDGGSVVPAGEQA